LVNSFNSEKNNGLLSKATEKQMKGYTISKETDFNEVCPDLKIATLKSIAFLQSIKIDTSSMNKSDMDMLFNLLNKNKIKPVYSSDGYFYPSNDSAQINSTFDKELINNVQNLQPYQQQPYQQQSNQQQPYQQQPYQQQPYQQQPYQQQPYQQQPYQQQSYQQQPYQQQSYQQQ